MKQQTKTILICSAISLVIAGVVVWASNEVDAVQDLIG